MICPVCGKQNKDGVQFCRHCGARLEGLVVAPEVITPVTPDAPKKEDVVPVKPPDPDPVTPPEPEKPAVVIEQKPVEPPVPPPVKPIQPETRKTEPLRADPPPIPPSKPPTPAPSLSIPMAVGGALLMLFAGMSGGFFAGRRSTSGVEDDLAQSKQIIERLRADAETLAQKNKELQGSLQDEKNKDQQNTAQLSHLTEQGQKSGTDMEAQKRTIARLNKQLQDAARDRQTATQVAEDKLKQAESAFNARYTDLQNTVATREHELGDLRHRLTQMTSTHEAVRPPPMPVHAGFLTWTGTALGKRTIDIRNGVVTSGAGVLTGTLPYSPCVISVADPEHVRIKTPPSPKNNWGRVAFEVTGDGRPMSVRINWLLSQ